MYEFQYDAFDLNYVGYTGRYLHLSIKEHKYSFIGKRLKDKPNQTLTIFTSALPPERSAADSLSASFMKCFFYKEKESDSEHSKWLHSSETFCLIFFLFLLFIPGSFVPKYFPTLFSTYNVIQQIIIFASDNGDISSPKRHVFLSWYSLFWDIFQNLLLLELFWRTINDQFIHKGPNSVRLCWIRWDPTHCSQLGRLLPAEPSGRP